MTTKNLFKYNNVIWTLPLLFQYDSVWGAIYNTLKMYDITPPKANLFGSPSIIWTGGRMPALYGNFKKEVLDKWFRYVTELNASPTFTFTSTVITKENLKDKYANFILETAFEYNSRFIVYSELLRDYIKEKNPNATIIASVIKASCRFQGPDKIEEPTIENETNYYNKLLKEYDIVVVRPEYSKNVLPFHHEYIDDISRLEVLINQPCIQNCPKMPDHYRYLEKLNVNHNRNTRFSCIRSGILNTVLYENNLIHNQETVEKLVKLGVKHLKLQGRSTPTTLSDLLLLLADQMFNRDGNNQIIISAMEENLNHEVYNFSQLIGEQKDITSPFV